MSEQYLSVVIVGTSVPPIWHWEKWKLVAAELDPLMASLKDKIIVRTTQTDENGKQARFGRIDWNENSHKKWTHLSPVNSSASGKWLFMYGEIWSPSWHRCVKDFSAPDLFISVENPFIVGSPRPGQYNQLFHLAVRFHLLKRCKATHANAIQKIASLIGATDIVMRTSRWNVNYYSIQDTLNNYLHYIGMSEDIRLDFSKTMVQWMPYEKDHAYFRAI
jgi:hypothetical protein